MSDTIWVEAVPGKVCPWPNRGPGKFVGVGRAPRGHEGPFHHRMWNGPDFVSTGPVEVPDVRWVRKALASGALKKARKPAPPSTPKAKRAKGGEAQ